jgi:hypothetical protein
MWDRDPLKIKVHQLCKDVDGLIGQRSLLPHGVEALVRGGRMTHETCESMHLLLVESHPDGKHGHHDCSTTMYEATRWIDAVDGNSKRGLQVLFQVSRGSSPFVATTRTKDKGMIAGIGPEVLQVDMKICRQESSEWNQERLVCACGLVLIDETTVLSFPEDQLRYVCQVSFGVETGHLQFPGALDPTRDIREPHGELDPIPETYTKVQMCGCHRSCPRHGT